MRPPALGIDDRYVGMPSGLLVPHAVAESVARRWRRPIGLDLFCGCGGFSLGSIQGGFEIVGALDFDPIAVMTYMTNLCRWGEVKLHFATKADERRLEKEIEKAFKRSERKDDGAFVGPLLAGSGWISGQPRSVPSVSHIFFGDIREFSGKRMLEDLELEVGELDLICGSPPCQGFSVANKNRGSDDPRNELVFEFARLVVELQPKSVCMENVPGIVEMTTPDGLPVVDTFCKILEDGGFHGVGPLRKLIKSKSGRFGLLKSKPRPKRSRKKRTEDDDTD